MSLKLVATDPALQSVAMLLLGHVFTLVFGSLVAWAAVAGGPWGLGFAILVGYSFLSTICDDLAKLVKANKV